MDDQNDDKHNHNREFTQQTSPSTPRSSDSIDLAMDEVIDTSIDHLYHNVYEMDGSDQSPSMPSIISYGEESRIDSELCHLVGGVSKMDKTKQTVPAGIKADSTNGDITTTTPQEETKIIQKNSAKKNNKKKKNHLPFLTQGARPPTNGKSTPNQRDDNSEPGLYNPDLGHFLLNQTRSMVLAGENPRRALESALRAVRSFEMCSNGKPNLDMVMALHVLASIYSNLGQYNEAIPVLERSIEIPVIEDGEDYALAKFAGCMQLGDNYAILGQIENSILFYTAGLEIQTQVLGETDLRVGETCRYVAEAHLQALQFDEAEKLCQMALDIHRNSCVSTTTLEEATDRKLMGLICDSKGNYETALENYVLASMAVASSDNDLDVAMIDCSIGDSYLSLARYDEAVFAYQKALAVFKSGKGENHPSVANVYVSLADLYNKIGKFKESKSYCENALGIYTKLNPGIPYEEIANGLIEVSAIYQAMNDLEQALKLLNKALKIFGDDAGQQSTVAGLEAQIGVLHYMMGKYSDCYTSMKSAISKLRESGEKKSGVFGIALNQLGLACVQRFAINEAAELFEEARSILEKEYGAYDPHTLATYSNLAGTYDAMGRVDDAIEMLEHVVGMREEKLGTANPDVSEEKRRLAELLKEAGRIRNRKNRSLEKLLDQSCMRLAL